MIRVAGFGILTLVKSGCYFFFKKLLSHVGGAAAIVLHTQLCVYLENMGRQGILIFISMEKNRMGVAT